MLNGDRCPCVRVSQLLLRNSYRSTDLQGICGLEHSRATAIAASPVRVRLVILDLLPVMHAIQQLALAHLS